MSAVRLRFLGCGDAFGSGGRMHTCFYLEGGEEPLLIDCGATSLQALKREGIRPESIGLVALSHLHGDHFGGLPWMILDGGFSGRTMPLLIAGPAGTQQRLNQAFEALYPGAPSTERPFDVRFVEYAEREPADLGAAVVIPFEVVHQSGAPSYGLRIQYAGRLIAYSGDTEWTDSLPDIARDADLFVCECNFFDKRVPGHLDFRTFEARREQFDCRRLILTHLSEDMLSRLDEVDVEAAADGMAVEV